MKQLFQSQQQLVNILVDKVKLIETHRYSRSHLVGYAKNAFDDRVLATHALVVEVVCHLETLNTYCIFIQLQN